MHRRQLGTRALPPPTLNPPLRKKEKPIAAVWAPPSLSRQHEKKRKRKKKKKKRLVSISFSHLKNAIQIARVGNVVQPGAAAGRFHGAARIVSKNPRARMIPFCFSLVCVCVCVSVSNAKRKPSSLRFHPLCALKSAWKNRPKNGESGRQWTTFFISPVVRVFSTPFFPLLFCILCCDVI